MRVIIPAGMAPAAENNQGIRPERRWLCRPCAGRRALVVLINDAAHPCAGCGVQITILARVAEGVVGMTSTYPDIPEPVVATEALWTRLHRWTPAEALSCPGRSAQRRALIQAGDDAAWRAFLAGLPDTKSRVIAVNNAFGPNLLPGDIAEFLTAIGYLVVSASEVEAVLDGPDDAPALPKSTAGLPAAIERARESLTSAQAAPTVAEWSSGSGTYIYEQALSALRDAQVASGQAVLAVAGELAATRAEIGEVAAAVRGLAATVADVVGGLGSPVTAAERTVNEDLEAVATGIGEVRAEIGEVCTEVGELCTEVAEIGARLRPVEHELEAGTAPVLALRLFQWPWRWRGGDRR